MNWIKSNQRLITISFSFVLIGITFLSLLPPRSTIDLGNNDKLSHFLAYSVLSSNALVIQKFKPFQIWLLVSLVIYGSLMEFFQGFVPGREVSLWDIMANTSGVFIGFLIFKLIEKNSKKKPEKNERF